MLIVCLCLMWQIRYFFHHFFFFCRFSIFSLFFTACIFWMIWNYTKLFKKKKKRKCIRLFFFLCLPIKLFTQKNKLIEWRLDDDQSYFFFTNFLQYYFNFPHFSPSSFSFFHSKVVSLNRFIIKKKYFFFSSTFKSMWLCNLNFFFFVSFSIHSSTSYLISHTLYFFLKRISIAIVFPIRLLVKKIYKNNCKAYKWTWEYSYWMTKKLQ